MAEGKNTIFEKGLGPVFQFLIDGDALRQFREQTDWQQVCDRYQDPTLTYPDYYTTENFHGVQGGYLNPDAATSYDPITQYVMFPNETLIRQTAVDRVQGQPRRILDLGCGTGSTTLLLKQAFPQVEVIGLDLSPYMLFMGDRKAQEAGLQIRWMHGDAAHTPFRDGAFDLVTASLLFHETPASVLPLILQEACRLLIPGGQLLILDGSQTALQQAPWLRNLFEEPFLEDYTRGRITTWMETAGFQAVQTEEHWWAHQISWGMKPLPQKPSPFTIPQTEPSDAGRWVGQPA